MALKIGKWDSLKNGKTGKDTAILATVTSDFMELVEVPMTSISLLYFLNYMMSVLLAMKASLSSSFLSKVVAFRGRKHVAPHQEAVH